MKSNAPHRLDPGGTPADFDTFRVTSPTETHTRPGTCEEVDCSPHRKGWHTVVPAGSADEALLLSACKGEIDGFKRGYVRTPDPSGAVRYTFEPGQPCLAASTHRVELERPALFLRSRGDWRAFLGKAHVYDRPDQWADDLHTSTDRRSHLRQTRG